MKDLSKFIGKTVIKIEESDKLDKGNGVLPCVSKRYLITFYSSTGGMGFESKIDAESKEDAENKARDMNSSAYFTIDEIV